MTAILDATIPAKRTGFSQGLMGQRGAPDVLDRACLLPAHRSTTLPAMRWTTPIKPALIVGERLFDRILCVAGAVAFSQFPEFIQQYLQRLGGHLDEARRQVMKFTEVAAQSKLTLPEFIIRTNHNSDEAVAKLGGVMQGAVDRVSELSFANAAMHDASLWERPFVFLRYVDPEIAGATWSIYQPAVPTTIEGLIYALIGMGCVLSLYYGAIKYPLSTALRARRARRSKNSQSTLKPTPPDAPTSSS